MLTQSPSASASLGASVKLTCTLNNEYRTYDIGWYQQQPDKAPKYLIGVIFNGLQYYKNADPDERRRVEGVGRG